MRVHFFSLLVIVVFFGCETNNEEVLNNRFELVNGTVESFVFSTKKHNHNLFNKLNTDDQLRLKVVKDHSEGIIKYLDRLKDVLIEKSGGRNPETAMLLDVSDFDLPYEFVRNSVYRMNLKDTVNSIVNELNSLGNQKVFAPIVIDGRDDPYWSQLPNQKAKTEIQLLFENVNISGALTSISQLQHRVLEYERLAYETCLLQELDSLRALSQ